MKMRSENKNEKKDNRTKGTTIIIYNVHASFRSYVVFFFFSICIRFHRGSFMKRLPLTVTKMYYSLEIWVAFLYCISLCYSFVLVLMKIENAKISLSSFLSSHKSYQRKAVVFSSKPNKWLAALVSTKRNRNDQRTTTKNGKELNQKSRCTTRRQILCSHYVATNW